MEHDYWASREEDRQDDWAEEYEELCRWRDLYLSRLMFGWIVGPEFTEHRSFDEFLKANAPHLARGAAS